MEFATIFDMDGVLVDTHDLIWNGVNNLLGKYKVTLTTEDIKRYIGKSLEDDVQDWNNRYSLSLNLEEFRVNLWQEQKASLKKLGSNSSLTTLLNELEANNISKGVGTSSSRFRAIKILDWSGLRNYFPVLVAAEDVRNHKPSPDTFLKVAQKIIYASRKLHCNRRFLFRNFSSKNSKDESNRIFRKSQFKRRFN